VVCARPELGYYILGFGGCAPLADPSVMLAPFVRVEDENNQPIRPPYRLCREVGGNTYLLDQFIPLCSGSFGRVEDCMRWQYLDENELLSLLRIYRQYGIRIDYFLVSGSLFNPQSFLAWGYVRENDILEWTDRVTSSGETLHLSFSRENIAIQLPKMIPSHGYGVLLCKEVEGPSLVVVGLKAPQNKTSLLLVSKATEGKTVVGRAALCRRHEPLLGELLAKGASLPDYLKLEFSSPDGSVKVVRVHLK